jgi:YD repeat-containing protein
MPAAWRKARRPAGAGLLAPDNISLPVASFVAMAGRDERLCSLNASAGNRAESPPPAEQARPLTLSSRLAETNAVGSPTLFAYNPDGSLAAMTNAFTNVWTYQYATAAGCCCRGSASVTTTDPLSRQVVENRSEVGLPVQTIFISGSNKTTNSITYVSGMVSPDQEAENYPQTITDEGGRTRTYAYTALGQLQTASDWGGNVWCHGEKLYGC